MYCCLYGIVYFDDYDNMKSVLEWYGMVFV